MQTKVLFDGYGSHGNMFKVEALKDVFITSFDIHTLNTGVGAVQVYTRQGDYTGYESSSGGWELIYDRSIDQQGRNTLTQLGSLSTPIKILRGSFQSFYIWAERKLVYNIGTSEGSVYASDDSLVFFEGIGVTNPFGTRSSPRVWNGALK